MFFPEPSMRVTATHLKQHNEGLLLSAIYGHKAISRVQLARLTHLSRPSVTDLTHSLIHSGLIVEIGPERAPTKVGKRATLLAFNPDAYHIAAVDMGGTKVIASRLDLRGQILHTERRAIDASTPERPLATLIDAIAAVINQADRPLLGIAVGTPGLVNPQVGVVQFASNLGWQDLSLSQILKDRFHLPVYIGNDTNLAALGEYRFGSGQGIEDLLVVMVGTGLGSGIIVGGRIAQGSSYGAGEIGHIPIGDLAAQCRCGKRGCLETMVSGWGLSERAKERAEDHPTSLLNHLSSVEPMSPIIVQRAMEAGDTTASYLVDEMGYYMGLALVTVIHLLNPRRIILGGSLMRIGERFLNKIRVTVQERALSQLSMQTDIVPSTLDDRVILLGAGALVLEQELGLWQA